MSELIVNTISGLSDLSVGNTTVNSTVNSTSFSTGDTNITGDTLSVGNTTVNSTVNSTSISIGSNNLTVGTSAYFVSNGNVGIGTTTPDGKFTVNAGSTTSFDVSNPSGYTLQLSHYMTTTGASSVRKVLSGIQGLVGSSDISNYQGSLAFLTTPSAGSPTERMRITSAGNVGIGTNSPSYKLHVVNASGVTIRGDTISSYGVYGTATSGIGIRGDSTSSVGVYGTSSSNFGVYGISTSSVGVYGISTGANYGGYFQGNGNYGVYGRTLSSSYGGVLGYNYNGGIYGILAYSTTYSFYGNGALSKASGSFRIPHPLPELKDTHDLVHSFVESPTADNIYRGKIQLQNGQATVNIDTHSGMTEGTFAALNGNVQVFLQNDSGWDLVRGSVSDNILTIISQNQQSSDTISWLVIAERQDEHMLETGWTDEFGRPTLEPLKMPDPILPEQEEV